MLLAIDASRSVDTIQKTGVEKVSDELLINIKNLSRARSRDQISKIKNNEFDIIYYTPRLISWLPTGEQKIIRLKRLWTVLGLSWEMLWHKPDVLFIPVHTLPFFCPQKTYKIIHDIAFKYEPRAYSFWQRLYLNFDLKRCLKKCQKIFVPSKKIKQDILNYVDIYVDKIIIVPHGYNRQSRASNQQLIKKRQILYLGRLEEKKNILNLIQGFKIFAEKFPDYKLILAGKVNKKYLDTLNSRFQIPDSINFLGYISEEKKHELLSELSCLVLISKEEGFGFPILEGFDFELPVLASDIPVLHEVGDDACLYVNPDSPEEIAQGLERIVSDENLRKKLIEKGRERLKKFSWKKATEKMLSEMIND